MRKNPIRRLKEETRGGKDFLPGIFFRGRSEVSKRREYSKKKVKFLSSSERNERVRKV